MSAAARLLESRSRIPLKPLMLVFCVCCVGSGLCEELITRSEETYRVCVCVCVCLIACDVETSTTKRPRPDLTYSVTKKNALDQCNSVR